MCGNLIIAVLAGRILTDTLIGYLMFDFSETCAVVHLYAASVLLFAKRHAAATLAVIATCSDDLTLPTRGRRASGDCGFDTSSRPYLV